MVWPHHLQCIFCIQSIQLVRMFCSSIRRGSYNNQFLGPFFQNLGYDLWIGNARGNTFSRNHTTLNPDEPQFWTFSWHQIGVYDLPAMIDYILSHTGQDKLIYIGHSQGVTSMFVLLSKRPEYNKKIIILHAIAPPIIMKYHHIVTPDKKDLNKLKVFPKRNNRFHLNLTQ